MSQQITRQIFPRRYRLSTSRDYRHVFTEPIRSADSSFTVLARLNKPCGPRLGVIVSKKNIAKAVQRNRIKRIVRDSFRVHKHMIGTLDVVVICKKDCVDMLNKQLFQQLHKHWKFLSAYAE